MPVDIIIPTIKAEADIQPLLAEIHANTPEEHQIVCSSHNWSAAANRNYGLEHSKSSRVVMCDDDLTGFYPGWLTDLLTPLNDGVALVSARLLTPDKQPAPVYGFVADTATDVVPVPGKEVPSACIAFHSVNARFDENFIGGGSEDIDYCRQLLKVMPGRSVVVANRCRIVHNNECKRQSGPIAVRNELYLKQKWSPQLFPMAAFYKTYSGEEWVEASLESIYPCVEKIVMLHSNVAWSAQAGPNKVAPVVANWKRAHDIDHKLVEIVHSTGDQDEQYRYGIDWIRRNYPGRYILFVDTDEVWDPIELHRAMAYVVQDPTTKNFACRMHTYVKSPLYRVTPEEPHKPMIILRDPVFNGIRNYYAPKYRVFHNIHFHHFTMVRQDREALRQKFIRSETGDKVRYNELNAWFDGKYANLPYAQNFHYARGAEHCWAGCEVIDPMLLPAAALSKTVVQPYLALPVPQPLDGFRKLVPVTQAAPTPPEPEVSPIVVSVPTAQVFVPATMPAPAPAPVRPKQKVTRTKRFVRRRKPLH